MSVEHERWALALQGLPPFAKLVLLPLAHHADEHGCCGSTVTKLAQETGLSERHVQRELKALELEYGCVRIERGSGRGKLSQFWLLTDVSSINKGCPTVTLSEPAPEKGDQQTPITPERVTNSRPFSEKGDQQSSFLPDEPVKGVPQSPFSPVPAPSLSPRPPISPKVDTPPLIPPQGGSPRPLNKLQLVVEAYLQTVGRDPKKVRNWQRFGTPLSEIADAVEPWEIERCTKWLKGDPFYHDQGKPPSPEQVVERYPGWVELGRPARWKPLERPRGKTGPTTIAQMAATMNGRHPETDPGAFGGNADPFGEFMAADPVGVHAGHGPPQRRLPAPRDR